MCVCVCVLNSRVHKFSQDNVCAHILHRAGLFRALSLSLSSRLTLFDNNVCMALCVSVPCWGLARAETHTRVPCGVAPFMGPAQPHRARPRISISSAPLADLVARSSAHDCCANIRVVRSINARCAPHPLAARLVMSGCLFWSCSLCDTTATTNTRTLAHTCVHL